MEAGLLGQLGRSVRGDAGGDCHRERPFRVVHPYMDVSGNPRVGRVDVVGAGRAGADQIGHRPEQHVITGPRPWFIGHQQVLGAEGRVVEQVQARPAHSGRNAVAGQGPVEVVGAVHVAGVTKVLVPLGEAGQPEGVVPAHRVADHLDQRLEVLVVELAVQPWHGVGVAHQRTGGGRVEPALLTAVEPVSVEGQEVRALLALDVDDLDVLTGLDGVTAGGGPVDAQVEDGVGQGGRQDGLPQRQRRMPAHLDQQVRRWVGRVIVHPHRRKRGRHEGRAPPGGNKALSCAGRRPLPEQGDGPQRARVHAVREHVNQHRVGDVLPGQCAQRRRRRIRHDPEHGAVDGAVASQHGQLRRLPAVAVHHRQLVGRLEPDASDAARPDPVGLEARLRCDQSRQQQPGRGEPGVDESQDDRLRMRTNEDCSLVLCEETHSSGRKPF